MYERGQVLDLSRVVGVAVQHQSVGTELPVRLDGVDDPAGVADRFTPAGLAATPGPELICDTHLEQRDAKFQGGTIQDNLRLARPCIIDA